MQRFFYTIDGILKTIVKQRTPIARISTVIRLTILINMELKFLCQRIILQEYVDNRRNNEENLQKFTRFVNLILADDFLKKEIIGIHKTQNNEFVLSVRSGQYKIEFGSLEEINVKFKKLKAFYNKAFVDKTIEQYKTINLKYHNQVVCAK